MKMSKMSEGCDGDERDGHPLTVVFEGEIAGTGEKVVVRGSQGRIEHHTA